MSRNRRDIHIILRALQTTLIAVAVLSGCRAARSTSPPETRTLVDELGRTVRVSLHPQRIVSLAPSITEILFAIGAGDRVAGVTSFCNYPPEARLKENVGDTLRPSVEKIVSLNADLVIISTASQLEGSVKTLEQLGVPVYVSNPHTVAGVLESIRRIGELVGEADRASELAVQLQSRVDSVGSRVDAARRPSVLVVLGTEPLITAGRGSFINDLVKLAGGNSVSAGLDGDYPQYSLEAAVASKPETILLQAGGDRLPASLTGTPAARAQRVFHIDDDLVLRPGPRIVDGLEQMAAKIHPEAFAAGSPREER